MRYCLTAARRRCVGRPELATIRNAVPAAFKVRYGPKTAEVSLKAGQALHLNAELQ